MGAIQARFEKYRAVLGQHGQEHLLRYWDELDDGQRLQLLDDLDQVDLARCSRLTDPYVKNRPQVDLPSEIVPPPILPAAADTENADAYAQAWRVGAEAIGAGKVAAFTVAGGQGTRLGFDGPKGAFKISPIRQAPLFQLFAEFLLGCQRRYGHRPRWYIMTSLVNHDETVRFFESHRYFGLAQDDVMFFQQGQMPAFLPDGRIALLEKHRLALGPDGHGGSLTALARSGALEDMRERGIEHLSYFQVDNPLVRPIDPLFIGLHIERKSELSSKAIPKAFDKERVGNFCIADGRLTVIEYSDLPDELAEARNDDSARKFDAGSIAIHVFRRDFVERVTGDDGALSLPWHRADKKLPVLGDDGQPTNPSEPNIVKLEMFVFDALPLAENPLVIYTRREEEFSPVKNAEGVDSPETTQRDLIRRAAQWLSTCGADVPRREDGEPDALLEIVPSFALDADDLRTQLKAAPTIERGGKLLLPGG